MIYFYRYFYKSSILKWIIKMFNYSKERKWYSVYFALDIHGVISKPDYRKTIKEINYYPYAKETLQLLSKRDDIVMFLFTSSYSDEINKYMDIFKKDQIHFKYINENLEISDSNGSFGYYEKKPYFNVYFEDKAGFNPYIDWYPIYKYFKKTKYLPDKSWNHKYVETYHKYNNL